MLLVVSSIVASFFIGSSITAFIYEKEIGKINTIYKKMNDYNMKTIDISINNFFKLRRINKELEQKNKELEQKNKDLEQKLHN